MSMTIDKSIVCAACNNEFNFTAEEQDFFATKGFQEPKKCKPCRDAAKQSRNGGDYGGGGGGGGGQREMHPATCSSCGIQTQVPFKPNGSKPVYCRECYQSSY